MASNETKVPAIKNVPAKLDPELKATLNSMKEAQEVRLGRRGDPRDRAVTLRELIDSGLAKELKGNPFNPNLSGAGTDFIPNDDAVGDLTIPPAPTGLEASGAFTEIIVDWNPAKYANHAYTEIWRSRADEIGGAILITTTNSFVISDSVGYNQTYYYWVRFVSTSNIKGPFNGTSGVKAQTIENIAATMTTLSETLADLPGYNLLSTTSTAATVIRSSGSPSTRGDGSSIQLNDIWFDTDDGQVYTRNASNNAWVASRDATLVNLYGSTSYTGSTITAAMAAAQADIVTVTNAQSSTASSLSSLTSTVNSNTSAISSEATTRASADTALATDITNLTSTVGSNTSSISTLSTTTASHTGDLNAMFVLTVATESNGSKSAAGMVIGSNASNGSGAQSYVQFQADKFAIWSGSSAVAPFIIDSGVVYIDTARIKDGAIENAKIKDGTIENAKIKDATIETVKIKDGQITNAKIDDLAVDNAKIHSLSAQKITADFINSDRINVDTLAVKKFANISSTIISHKSDESEVPLSVQANVQSWSGTYPGQTIVSSETSSVVNISCTTANIRNNAKYRVVVSAVLGDVRNGTIQYSFNNSSWTSLSPTMNANAGTYRTYAYIWDGTITGLSSSQSTVYWRINWNVSGGQVNSTYQAMYVTVDNTQ